MEENINIQSNDSQSNNQAKQDQNLTFVVCGYNGSWMIEKTLQELGWRKLSDNKSNAFRLKWVELKSSVNYDVFNEGEQMVNRIPNCYLLTNKLGLLTSLQRFERIWMMMDMARHTKISKFDFFPETYRLDDPAERKTFLSLYKPDELWICKPIGLNQGRGIWLLRDIEQFKKTVHERIDDQRTYVVNTDLIVQRYIRNPLLLERKKFDIRVFMLVASTQPFLIFYRKGYARLSLLPYDPDADELSVHLTNQFIQRKDPNYESHKNETIWSFEKLNNYINKKYAADKEIEIDWLYNSLTNQMKEIMLICFHSVKSKLKTKVGYFDLYGLDFMIDENMKLWLIEVNANPCLATNCETLQNIIPDIIKETLYLAIECFEKARRNMPLYPLRNYRNFEVLYNGTSNFSLETVSKMRRNNNFQSFLSHFIPPKADEIPVTPKINASNSRNLSMSIVFGRDLTDEYHPKASTPFSMFELSSQEQHTKRSEEESANSEYLTHLLDAKICPYQHHHQTQQQSLTFELEQNEQQQQQPKKTKQEAELTIQTTEAKDSPNEELRNNKLPAIIQINISNPPAYVEKRNEAKDKVRSKAAPVHATTTSRSVHRPAIIDAKLPPIVRERQAKRTDVATDRDLIGDSEIKSKQEKEMLPLKKSDSRLSLPAVVDETSSSFAPDCSKNSKEASLTCLLTRQSKRADDRRSLNKPSNKSEAPQQSKPAASFLPAIVAATSDRSQIIKPASSAATNRNKDVDLNGLIRSIRKNETAFALNSKSAYASNAYSGNAPSSNNAIAGNNSSRASNASKSYDHTAGLSPTPRRINYQMIRLQELMVAEDRLKELRASFQPNVFSMAFNESPKFNEALVGARRPMKPTVKFDKNKK